MFIVMTTPVARPSSVGAAPTEVLSPMNLKRTQIGASPTELGATCGTVVYKHGAPSGAFWIPLATPPTTRTRAPGRAAP